MSFLLKYKVTNSRLLRWILAIGEYSFTIKYWKGKDNSVADILSRYVTEEREEIYNKEVRLLPIRFETNNDVKRMLQNLAEEQDQDLILGNLKRQSHLSAQCKLYNNILFKLIRHDWKIVLTNKMLFKMITPTHESLAHASALKCYLSLREDFTINNMFRKIKGELKKCYDCQTAKPVSYTHLDVYKRQGLCCYK